MEYVDRIVHVEKENDPSPKVPYHVIVDKAIDMAEKKFAEKLVPYLYTCWKLVFHLRVLNEEYKSVRALLRKQNEPIIVKEVEPPQEMQQMIGKIKYISETLKLILYFV